MTYLHDYTFTDSRTFSKNQLDHFESLSYQ